jgi:urease accessory protein
LTSSNSTGQLYELMHLADSGLPAGGYAFSSGLEGAYHLGLLSSGTALQEFVQCAVETAARSDIPFIHSVYLLEKMEPEQLEAMLQLYDAMTTAPTMRRASRTQGKNWLRLLSDLYPRAGLDDLSRWLADNGLPTHFAVLFGATLRSIGFAEGPGRQLFLFQILRDQMSAAVRLGVIGPLEAARRQQGMYEFCTQILDEVDGIEYTGATRAAPQLDIAQSLHDHLYSRLFQS